MINSGTYNTMPASRDDCHLCHIHDHNHPSTLLRTSTLRESSPPPRPRRHSRAGSIDRDYHHHHRDHHHHHHHHHDRERRHSRSGRVPSALARLSEHNSHSLPASRSNTLNLYPEQVSVLPDGGHRFIGGDRVSVRSLELTSPRHAADNRSHHSLQQTTTLQKPLPDPLGSSYLPLHSHGGSHLSLQQATVVPTSQDRAQDYYLQVNRLPFKDDTRKHRFNLQTVLLIGCYTLLFVMAIIIGLVLCHQNGWLGFGSPVSLTEVVEEGGVHINGGSVRRPNFDNGRLTNLHSENEPSDTLQHLTEVSSKPIPVHNVVHVRKVDPNSSDPSPSGRPRSISGARDHQNEPQQTQTIPGNRPVQRVPDGVVNDAAVASSNEKIFRTPSGAASGINPASNKESPSTGSTNANNPERNADSRPISSVSNNGNVQLNPSVFPRIHTTSSGSTDIHSGHGNEPFLPSGQPKQPTENIFLPRGPVQTTHFTTNNLPVATHAGPPQIGNNFPQNVQLLTNQNVGPLPSNVHGVPNQSTVPITGSHGSQNLRNFPGQITTGHNQNRHNFPSGLPTAARNENNFAGSVQAGNNFPASIQTLPSNTAGQIIPQNVNGAHTASNVGKTIVISEQIQARPENGNTVLKKQPLRIILNAGHLSTSSETNPPSHIAPFSGVNSKLPHNNGPQGFTQAAAIINGNQQGIRTLTQANPSQGNNLAATLPLSPVTTSFPGNSAIPGSPQDKTRFNPNTSSHQTTSSQGVIRDAQQVQTITTSRIPGASPSNGPSVAQKVRPNIQGNVPIVNQDSIKTTGFRVPKLPSSRVIAANAEPQPASPNGAPPNTFRPQIVHSEFSTVPPLASPGPIFSLHAQNDLHRVKEETKTQQIPRQRLPIPSTSLNVNTQQAAASTGKEKLSRETAQGISLSADGLADTNLNKAKKVQNSAVDINDIHMEKMKILKEILDAEGSGKLLQDLITLKNNKNSISELSEQLSESAAKHRPPQPSGEPLQKADIVSAPLSHKLLAKNSDSASAPTGEESKVQVTPNRPQSGRQPQSSKTNVNAQPSDSKEKKRNNIQVVRELLASLISSPEVQEILSTRNRQGKRAELKGNSQGQSSEKNSAKGDEVRNLLLQALAKEVPPKQVREEVKPTASRRSDPSAAQKIKEKSDTEKTAQPRRTITRAQQLAHFSTGTPGRIINKRIGSTDSQQGSREHQSVRPPTARTSRGRRTQVDGRRSTAPEQITRRKAKSIRRTTEGVTGIERPRGVVRHWRTTDQHGTMSQGTVRSDGSFAFTNCRPAQMCQDKSLP